MHYLLIISSI